VIPGRVILGTADGCWVAPALCSPWYGRLGFCSLHTADYSWSQLLSTVQQCACGRGYLRAADGPSFCTLANGVVVQMIYCTNNGRILLANSNQRYFNKLVKIPCHKTPYRCPRRLNLSSQSSRSCAGPNIKALKDKDLEFANGIRAFVGHRRNTEAPCTYCPKVVQSASFLRRRGGVRWVAALICACRGS
jgi:hypothetical protein